MISKLKAVLDDDRGVSPVIGVILMVAITVILAAVIGTFVLGLGDSLEQAPQAQLDATSDASDTVTISHNGGDSLEAANIDVIVDGNTVALTDLDGYDGDSFSVGESFDVEGDTGDNDLGTSIDGSEVRVRLVHTPSESIILDTQVEVQA